MAFYLNTVFVRGGIHATYQCWTLVIYRGVCSWRNDRTGGVGHASFQIVYICRYIFLRFKQSLRPARLISRYRFRPRAD